MKKIVLTVVVFAVFVTLGLAVMGLFSKRPEDLGVQAGRLRDCPDSPNCVASQASDDEHRMIAIPFKGEAAAARRRLVEIIKAMPRSKVVTADDRYIHAEFTSALFRFVDDVEFLIDENNQSIEFRSASRVGHSDLGANRRRIEEIQRRFADDDQAG